MKQGKKLLILPAVAVLLGMGTGCSDNSENKAQDKAKKALMASVDNPESVKIVGISKPDSVFGREYVTMKEKMALSVAMMKISRRFMEDTDFDNPDSECHGMSGQMKRQMDAMTALRSLMVSGELKPMGDESSQERKPFSGWKVKIEYEATDFDGQPYRSEYWFIMDKEAQCILLDGFSTKEGKTFPTVLELADDGAVNMQSVIGRCPHCGGEVRVGTRAFNCSNYSNQEAPCLFAIWRNIGGHQLTLEEAKELCEKNITSSELEMYREDGSIYRKRLGLAPDKLQIVKI